MAFFPLLFTLSRASYLGLFAGIIVIGLTSRRAWVVALIVGVIVLSILFAPQKVVDRVLYTFQPDSGKVVGVGDRGISVDSSTYERVEVWRKVGYILRLGGIFTLFGGGVSWETVLDSQYARVILETGLVGLAAFLFLQWRLLVTARQAYRWTDDWFGRGIAIGTFATTVALIVHSAGTISFLIVRIMEPYWFLMALCVLIRNDAIAKHTARVMAQRIERARTQRTSGPATPETAPTPAAAGM
jgi:O-antigen ligase